MIPDVSYEWIFFRKHTDEMGNWGFKTGRRFHLSKRGIIVEASLSYCTIEKTSFESLDFWYDEPFTTPRTLFIGVLVEV